ncbi:hypothetical protein D3C76_988940 [compost metagenome]
MTTALVPSSYSRRIAESLAAGSGWSLPSPVTWPSLGTAPSWLRPRSTLTTSLALAWRRYITWVLLLCWVSLGWSSCFNSARTRSRPSALPRTSTALLRGSATTWALSAPCSPASRRVTSCAVSAALAWRSGMACNGSSLTWSSWRNRLSIRSRLLRQSVTTSKFAAGYGVITPTRGSISGLRMPSICSLAALRTLNTRVATPSLPSLCMPAVSTGTGSRRAAWSGTIFTLPLGRSTVA